MIQNNSEGNPLSFFYTSEYGANAPNMRITYITDHLGLNPYWGYANTPWGSVNTLSGNFLSSAMDYSLPGRGIPIAICRTYNAGRFKWNFRQQMVFQHRHAAQVQYLGLWSGGFFRAERPFLLASDGQTFIAPTNYPMQLYKNGDGTFTVQEAYLNPGIIDKAEYKLKDELPSATFNNSGKLISLKDGKGNITSLTWNSSSVVINDPSNRQVTINIDTNGRATSIQDFDGVQKAAYSYDGSGNLTGVTYKDAISGNKSVSYEWHDGVIIKAVDKNGTPVYLQYMPVTRWSVSARSICSAIPVLRMWTGSAALINTRQLDIGKTPIPPRRLER
jgi:YD repeat-containing protein